MEGTPPALKDPMLVHDPERSLFASLMQAHHYWGNVARKAVAGQSSAKPWEADSDFAQVKMKLFYWEKNLPAEHKWSPAVLKDNRQKRTDLVGH